MNLFRSRKARQVSSAPLPDWDDTRWRSHLRSNALGTDHHCNIYLEMINTDRKEAARLFKNEDDTGARMYAESSLRNKRIVGALAALSPLCNALFQRAEPLAGYTSLVQIPEPARSGIVTIIFAAGRLQLSYLTDTVSFLREQFGHVHIDGIQSSEGELSNLVNATVRNALSPTPPEQNEVDGELASAVKEYFGISVSPAASRRNKNSQQYQQQTNNPNQQSSTVALSTHSSELGTPQSPEFSATSSQQQQFQLQQQQQQLDQRRQTRPRPASQQPYDHEQTTRSIPTQSHSLPVRSYHDNDGDNDEHDRDHDHEEDDHEEDDHDDMGTRNTNINAFNRFGDQQVERRERGRELQQQQQHREIVSQHIDDSDETLIRRYNDLRASITV